MVELVKKRLTSETGLQFLHLKREMGVSEDNVNECGMSAPRTIKFVSTAQNKTTLRISGPARASIFGMRS